MARTPEHHDPSQVLEELESFAERGAQWIRDHLPLTLTLLAGVLVAAALISVLASQRAGDAEAASDALDRVRAEYMRAMGADPDDLAVPELANPSAAEKIRGEFADQFEAIAQEHAGTVAGAFARLEQGNLAAAAGDTQAAIATWRQAAEEQGDPSVRAILEQRVGRAYEAEGRWLEAASAYEAAGGVESYRLRHVALAEAARCLLQAGEIARARDLALRVDSEFPDLALPPDLSSELDELRQMPAR